MSINHTPKKKTDYQSLIDDFIADGGKVTKVETKPMPSELGISNNSWNNKLTKKEKDAKAGK